MGRLQSIIESARETIAGAFNGPARELEAATAQLRESFSTIEGMMADDAGWRRLTTIGSEEFTLAGVKRNSDVCRLMSVSDPLVKRGVHVRAGYVFGAGVGVTATATAENSSQDVNAVIQAFWDAPANRRALTGMQAQHRLEHAQATDGNIFIALRTDPTSGAVTARTIPLTEITGVLTNPENAAEPRYFLRSWTEKLYDATSTQTVRKEAYYPALGWRPVAQPQSIGGIPVDWTTPIHHQADGSPDGWAWGVPDIFAALPWARAYKIYLEDWARLMRALARISHRVTAKTNKAASEARRALQHAALSPTPGVIGTVDATVEAMPKTGATIDAESGKPLASMVAAALGVPVTMLLGDPGQTGARAVAETLDRPMLNDLMARQHLWQETYRAILGHVIDAAIAAPQGPLKGTVKQAAGQWDIKLPDGVERTLVFHFPDLNEQTLAETIDAVTKTYGTGLVPYETLALITLRALGVRDPDEIIAGMKDPTTGEFIPAGANLADAIIAQATRGERSDE